MTTETTTACDHTPAAVCFLCSDAVPWWREARIAAGLGAEPVKFSPPAPVERLKPLSPRKLLARYAVEYIRAHSGCDSRELGSTLGVGQPKLCAITQELRRCGLIVATARPTGRGRGILTYTVARALIGLEA